jgi:hypothetical protein
MTQKLIRTLGSIALIIVLLGAWHYFLVSTRPDKLKEWENCKTKLLESWAESHSNQKKELVQFSKDYFYSFGGESSPNHFDDHDSRATAKADAENFGIQEDELIRLDLSIGGKCGPFPRS